MVFNFSHLEKSSSPVCDLVSRQFRTSFLDVLDSTVKKCEQRVQSRAIISLSSHTFISIKT